jgi:hypothetical protein
MTDITIIYLTQNLLPERWVEFQLRTLFESIGGAPIITISRKPVPIVGQHIIQTEPSRASNVYWQMLKAAKLATTKYIGVAEDDSLYVQDHFNFIPPRDDTFYYNCSRWSLFTWSTPMYSWRDRKTNACLIANRELVIEALEERFAKYPNGTPDGATGELGRARTDKALGLTKRKEAYFYTNNPIIQVDHEFGLDERSKRHRKNWGSLRAYDIPTWGKAEDVIKNFK